MVITSGSSVVFSQETGRHGNAVLHADLKETAQCIYRID